MCMRACPIRISANSNFQIFANNEGNGYRSLRSNAIKKFENL